MATVADVMAWVEHQFPQRLAESWDTPGLMLGRPERQVRSVHFAVDPTLAVAAEAVALGADVLLTHHPLMLRGVTTVGANTAHGAVVHTLIEAGCALIAAHTNADAAAGGTNDALAAAFGLAVEGPLVADGQDATLGSGRIGVMEPIPLVDFARIVARALPATAGGVLFAGEPDALVSRVAVCGGSGDSFLAAAAAAGVDAYVTADLRHHPASSAREEALQREGKPYLVNVSHAASESLWLAAAATNLAATLGVATTVSTLNTDPWTGHVPSES